MARDNRPSSNIHRVQPTVYSIYAHRGCFLRTRLLFYERATCQARPIRAHTSFGHRPAGDCRLCGWLSASGTQDLRALRLWKSSRQWRAPAVELHGCCTRTLLAEALLRQHIDGVARASSVSNESGSRARSLVLLTMLAPVSRCARLEDSCGRLGEEYRPAPSTRGRSRPSTW